MRPLRIAAIGALLALVAIAIGIFYAFRHQTRLVRIVLAQIDQRTGMHIAIAGARVVFRGRLVVVLEHPHVALDGREIARLADIRATLNYDEIIHHQGLPLHSLALDRPEVNVAALTAMAPQGGSEQADLKIAAFAARAHDVLSGISRRIDVNGASLIGEGGPLATSVYISAFRRLSLDRHSRWEIRFNSLLKPAPVRNVRLAGDLRLAGAGAKSISNGRLWFWDLDLDKAGAGGLWLSAQAYGSVGYALDAGAKVNGAANVHLLDAVAGGERLTRTIALGAYSFKAAYDFAPARLDIAKFALRSAQSDVVEGGASIGEPFSAARTVTFNAGGSEFDLTHVARWLRKVRGVSPDLLADAERLRSGSFTIAAVALNKPQPIAKLTPSVLRKELAIDASVAGVGYAPMPESKLPPVSDFAAQIAYANSVARLTQGTARIGGSSINDVNIIAKLGRAPARIPYRATAAGQIAVGEAYKAAKDAIRKAAPALRRNLVWIHGHAPFTANASGVLTSLAIAPPSNYRIMAKLGDIQFEINNAPSAIELASGGVTVLPGRFTIKRATAVMIDQKTGSVLLDGTIIPRPGAPAVRDFRVELHQVETSEWLPMLVNPSQLAIKGLLGGQFVANSVPARGPLPTISGALTLGAGSVKPAFLRSPITVKQAATLTLDGKGLAFDIPDGSLEGASVNFRAAVPDFDRPALRIDAKTARLNFEVMPFIRLPWMPKTPPSPLPLPVSGHIEAAEGNLAQLVMTDISTDFAHNSKVWRVYNFHARAFNGDTTLSISGSGLPNDDWINIKGRIDSMDAGPLFMLAGGDSRPPLTGKLSAAADLWADTGADFFSTLAGNLNLNIVDGHLDRFTLLTRILSLINLKNWLTASFPDPRVAGIPFNRLGANFKGVKGAFYTDDLRLDGPVMDITANGNVDLASGDMDMRIGMVPFSTVSWIISYIPLIGSNLAGGTNGLIAAYFHVYGPIRNPTILPLPIKSVAEFVIKTIGLPINIIRPNTLK